MAKRKPTKKRKKQSTDEYRSKLKSKVMQFTAIRQIDNYITTGVQKPSKNKPTIFAWEDRNRSNNNSKLNS